MEQDMNVDPQRIRQLREARAWSQEHLAEICGLSTRTIQRLETSGAASAESRLALASAFGVEAASLLPAAAAAATPVAPATAAGSRLTVHLLAYVVVCGGLVALDLAQHGGISWSKWPLLGWGLALLIRTARSRIFTRVA